MPELRKDPISGRWVVISTERGKRPTDFKGETVGKEIPKNCPFCDGNEKMTPPEILAWRKPETRPNETGWDVRVTQNKFPALTPEGEINRRGDGMYDYMSGIGVHEVIIDSPRHDLSLAEMEVTQIEKILWAYKERIVAIEQDKRFRYVLVFRNYGIGAGASLAHPHSQLIATPITPRYVKLELATSRQYFLDKERCIFCDLIKQDLNSGERIVAENEYYVAIAPFASRFPFELWILPRRHHACFQDMPDLERGQLAMMMKDIMGRLMKLLNDPPYNYMLHTAPNPALRAGRPDYWGTILFDYHWHIEIIPRLTKQAGFEWGSGLYINPTSPEQAAKFLREIA
jgi:UDPglucose--hexose-1-phosphate uridylyltransferase